MNRPHLGRFAACNPAFNARMIRSMPRPITPTPPASTRCHPVHPAGHRGGHAAIRPAMLATGLLLALAVAAPCPLPADESNAEPVFEHGPDSMRQDDVPRGQVSRHQWHDQEVYPDTLREYYLYVPAAYDPAAESSAALMVFQDGHTYVGEDGDFRVPVVFDNLIHQGDMPVTIAVMINPGWFTDQIEPGRQGWPVPDGVRSNRSVEYDTLSADYARFLELGILDQLGKTYRIHSDPRMRAIAGISSGGICAFTAAWERPDLFGKVMSHIGSFVNIRCGDTYPGLIRKADERPLRVFLQAGRNDLDNQHGHWWLANLQMEKALAFRDYDHKLVAGDGAHNGRHGGAILPDSLRWLWRDWRETVEEIAQETQPGAGDAADPAGES